jgi:hypothetical protein
MWLNLQVKLEDEVAMEKGRAPPHAFVMTKLTSAMVRFQSAQKREKQRGVTWLRERCGEEMDGLALVIPKLHVRECIPGG